MRRRPDPAAVSPRAMAWLRTSARGRVTAGGWLPPRPAGAPVPDPGWAAADDPSADDTDEVVESRREVGSGDGWSPSRDRRSRSGRSRDGGARSWPARAGASVRRVVRMPATLSGARWQPGRPAVLGVLVVVLAVTVLGLRVAWARAEHGDVVAPGARDGPVGVSAGAVSVGVPQGGPSASASGTAGSVGSGASPSPGAGASGSAVLVVHVVGRVRHPGVLRLPVGSRVADAVDAAGGASAGADLAALNLARLLVDGEQVRVPAPGEAVAAPGGGVSASGGAAGPAGGAKVSLSTADAATLDTLPGIGPVLAQRIVDWRTENGRFTSVDELGEVSGIGEKLLAQVRPLVVP